MKRLGFALLMLAACLGLFGCTPSHESNAVLIEVEDRHANEAQALLKTFEIKAKWDAKNSSLVVDRVDENHARVALFGLALIHDAEILYSLSARDIEALSEEELPLVRRVQMQGALGDLISRMRKIESAVVNLTPAARPYYYRFAKEDLRAKASVMVSLPAARRLSESEAMTIARVVSGWVETLEPQSVYIQDTNGVHYAFDDEWEAIYSWSNAIRSAEESAERKAEAILDAYQAKAYASIALYSGEAPEGVEGLAGTENVLGINFLKSSIALSISEASELDEKKIQVLKEAVSAATGIPSTNVAITLAALPTTE